MYIGFLTAPFRNEPFDSVVEFAKQYGFQGLEVVAGVGEGHIDAQQVLRDKGSKVKKLL
ncbi:MAG TPA: sugar phosphate isomerase/epimerase, partial [Armatimonadetes bacterium]|nr:sugar phosphate isomerase/epimerase [Armatimonadota bacterium]